MDKISLNLTNCYGIKKLVCQFDFTQRKAYAIYAPNGSMKSSLAETFKNVADGTQPKDRIFPSRKSVSKITDENGSELPQASVLVLPPYDEFFSHNEKTSTLLVNNVLRKQYEQLHTDINASKKQFLELMKDQSGSKKELENEIALAFTPSEGEAAFYDALERVKTEVKEQKEAPFADVDYDAIFDEKVIGLLESKDCKAAIKDYITRYNELLAASTYFKKGVFEYYNASQIAKVLTDNGFFKANHTITLNATEKVEISTQAQLEALIAKELENITKDLELKKKFAALKKLLEKNVTVREFQNYICSHELLLPHLENIQLFKQNIWKSYFKRHEAAYNDLIDKNNQVKSRRKEIKEAAGKERTLWEAAIDLFNERFVVPFTLEAKNKIDVLLGNEALLNLDYTFKDGSDSAKVERNALMKSLSQGERKALYILNIIFEIEVRRNNKTETLFVVDDIADSFDYRNKYAIIQYLSEISEGAVFKQIILTHNFDFFRTISSRFVGYAGSLMATRSQEGIVLDQASGIRNIFVRDWKLHFFSDNKKRIASIPFMRNLIEYTRGTSDPDYIKLTSLLHWKSDSAGIKQAELDQIYRTLFGGTGSYSNGGASVVDLIDQEAKACLSATTGVNFENKIVLAIAIRLVAERFMVSKLGSAITTGIEENQTQKLLQEFQKNYSGGAEAIKALRCVVIMTPENIHLNAFMYEPILDMSDEHLRDLYKKVSALK
jgi:hypothetical protein